MSTTSEVTARSQTVAAHATASIVGNQGATGSHTLSTAVPQGVEITFGEMCCVHACAVVEVSTDISFGSGMSHTLRSRPRSTKQVPPLTSTHHDSSGATCHDSWCNWSLIFFVIYEFHGVC
jgi:hypothetical protein